MTKTTNKYLAIFSFLVFFIITNTVNAQRIYSNDVKETKRINFSLKFWKGSKKHKPKEYKQQCHTKLDAKASKKVMKHSYRIQTKKVRKRMKINKKKSEQYNRNKLPLVVKVKRWIHG